MPNRWFNVETIASANNKDIKMYRDRFTADKTISVELKNNDLDKIAYDYLGSELLMYKIMDINAVSLIEERGDLSRIEKVEVPNT